MGRLIGCFLCLSLLLGTGCASRTVFTCNKVQLGLRSEAHEFKAPALTRDVTTGETRFTLGFVSFGFIGRALETAVQAIQLESTTGVTATVDGV